MTATPREPVEARVPGSVIGQPAYVTAGVVLVGVILLLAILLVLMEFGMLTRHRTFQAGPARALPKPTTGGGLSLTEVLARRRSVREFADRPLSAEQVAQLCWAAQGITEAADGFRTAPSAGALYPLTLYVVDSTGVALYDPGPHALREVFAGDIRADLQGAAHDQPWVGSAPICLVIAIDVDRAAAKYGRHAEQYCLLEAGHAAQNVLLQATALGLGAVPVGAFTAEPVARLLRMPGHLRAVYLIPIGYPAGR